METYRVR